MANHSSIVCLFISFMLHATKQKQQEKWLNDVGWWINQTASSLNITRQICIPMSARRNIVQTSVVIKGIIIDPDLVSTQCSLASVKAPSGGLSFTNQDEWMVSPVFPPAWSNPLLAAPTYRSHHWLDLAPTCTLIPHWHLRLYLIWLHAHVGTTSTKTKWNLYLVLKEGCFLFALLCEGTTDFKGKGNLTYSFPVLVLVGYSSVGYKKCFVRVSHNSKVLRSAFTQEYIQL